MTARYKNASDLRRALDDRLKQQAAATGHDVNRLRRMVVFDRLATRLAADDPGRWILKGGAVLEFRLHGKARMTKDLDFAARLAQPTGPEVRDLLIEALARDHDGDTFTFRVGPPTDLADDADGRSAWRFTAEAWLAGRVFSIIRVDVAARSEELAGTEQLPLPNTLAFAGMPEHSIEAVDRRQHFAEKLHAYTREYGGRPNTRVKDLIDLVLLIENGLAPDPTLAETVRHVFAIRRTHPVPTEIPDAPPAWSADYPALAYGVTAAEPDLATALGILRLYWADVSKFNSAEEPGPGK